MTWNLTIEALALAAVSVFAFLIGPSRHSKRLYLRLAGAAGKHRVVAIGASTATALGMTLFLARTYQPVPVCHDEFSYLLAADTYAQGRATNPTHPMWEHFETFHVIQNPSYMSKYPPMQGLFLAAGQRTYGHPIAGVWLSVALAAGAFCWMLFGWLPSRWAALGGVLFGIHPVLFLTWGQCYYGGSVATFGACLLFGALPRIRKRPQLSGGLALAAGLVVLANSRPFEGFVISLPVALALFVWLIRADSTTKLAALWKVILPVLSILAAAGAAMAWHNQQITGNPLKLPYQVHEETYAVTPLFVFGTPQDTPTYRHREMRRFFEFDCPQQFWETQQTLDGWKQRKWNDSVEIWRLYFGRLLTVPLLALPWILKDPRMRFALLAAALVIGGSLMATWLISHYIAPILPLLLLLVLQGLRHLRTLRCDRGNFGRSLVSGLLLLYVALVGWQTYGYFRRIQQTPPVGHWAQKWAWERENIRQQLLATPGKHLIVVQYGPRHAASPAEWVYNEADIDSSRIVWARNMDGQSNGELVNYFKDRRLWLVLADEQPPRLIEHKTRKSTAGPDPKEEGSQ